MPITPLTRETFPLTGVVSYTIGTGGMFNTPRPVKIEAIAITSAGGSRHPARLAPIEEYDSTLDTTLAGLFAEICFCDGGFPLMTLNFYPKPASGGTVDIASYKPLPPFANLTDTVSLMPGYTDALRWALAIELAPEFGRPVTQEMMALATNSKNRVTGLNQAVLGKPNTVEPMDPAVPPRQVG